MTYETHQAEYLYPGAFFPESTFRDLTAPTLEAALAVAPDEDGYFRKDGWYAVRVQSSLNKVFTADDGETTTVKNKLGGQSWIVGRRVHYTEIHPEGGKNDILISNIRSNSKDGYGVQTRAGNWQIADDYDHVVSEDEVR